MPTTSKALFVLGCPRSGTTLMAGVLSQLRGTWIGNETVFVPFLYEPGTGSLQDWNDRQLEEFIRSVNSYLTMAHWTTLASVSGARRFWAESGVIGYSGFIRYVWSLDAAREGRTIQIEGDQTPNYVLALPLLEQLFPDALYVHVVRDPRDVVASVLPLRFGAQSAGVAAAAWNECVSSWWAAERRIPAEHRCEVRYEDLVTAPIKTMHRLAAFLNTESPDVDDVATLARDMHGLARVASHHHRLAEPIDDRSVGRHRRDLSARDRELVEAITYSALVTYGYEVGPYRPSPVLEENALLLTREHLRDLRRRAMKAVTRRWPR